MCISVIRNIGCHFFFIAYWLSVSIVPTEKQCKSMTKRLLRNIFVDQACFWTKSAINPELKTVVVFYISILYIFGLPQIYYMIDCFPNVNGQSWLWLLGWFQSEIREEGVYICMIFQRMWNLYMTIGVRCLQS